jgi:hypothetical protein
MIAEMRLRQILLQQLHMDGKRAEWIADLVRQPRQQPDQQQLLLVGGHVGALLRGHIGEQLFHERVSVAN